MVLQFIVTFIVIYDIIIVTQEDAMNLGRENERVGSNKTGNWKKNIG